MDAGRVLARHEVDVDLADLAKNTKAASVTFDKVTKVYGKSVTAVDDISLQIEPGKLVTLLGPSGCGKTTTLRMITGLEMATTGRILIGEANLIPCVIENVEEQIATVSVGGLRHQLAARDLPVGPALIAVRPSRLQLKQESGDNTIAARISKATYVGNHMEYMVEAGFGEVIAVADNVSEPLVAGQDIGLGFARSGPALLPGD